MEYTNEMKRLVKQNTQKKVKANKMEYTNEEWELIADALISASFRALPNSVTHGDGMQVELTEESKQKAYDLYAKVARSNRLRERETSG